MNTNKNAESMMLSSVIQLLAFNKMKAQGLDLCVSNPDHAFKDFYEDGKDMWAGHIAYFMLGTTESAETLEAHGILTQSEKVYFLDENEDEQEVDVDIESGFPLYYFNGYPLDTDEFEIMHKYRINDEIVSRAKEIIESLTGRSKFDILFNVINEENTKFFIPLYVATLFDALKNINNRSEISETFVENFLLVDDGRSLHNTVQEYLTHALKDVQKIDTVVAFSVRYEEQNDPIDWKKTISFK